MLLNFQIQELAFRPDGSSVCPPRLGLDSKDAAHSFTVYRQCTSRRQRDLLTGLSRLPPGLQNLLSGPARIGSTKCLKRVAGSDCMNKVCGRVGQVFR